ncbi:NAD(P)-dependent oxidoreductase [Allorhizocola rhizosphaerae]|uniref:NAD(P)-dependent oxidoreductase n=1 Tax=Allorhizocola rhizosphaerae TaxID=1872709 RepID=UPI0014786FF5|nr:NAD(P)H-binding protein [Allorhizocola rhizosphaerae]
MSRIIVFGAGGKAGRAVISEAVNRGHDVTAVVRDPSKYEDLGVTVVAGDVCDASSVASLATGHDAAVNAAYDPQSAPADFFVGAAKAFLEGLPKAGVGRAVVIGMVSNLEVAPGLRMLDTPDFPEAYREFAQGHTAGLDTLRAAETELDWVVLTPPMVLDLAARTGTYRTGGDQLLAKEDGTSHLSYADLAVAIVDEIENPQHHRTRIAVAD